MCSSQAGGGPRLQPQFDWSFGHKQALNVHLKGDLETNHRPGGGGGVKVMATVVTAVAAGESALPCSVSSWRLAKLE